MRAVNTNGLLKLKRHTKMTTRPNKTESIMTPAKFRDKSKQMKHYNRNLHSVNYDDLNLTSMKPLPSSSMSKNFISRLSEISSPVTRKLKFWNKKSFQVNQYDPSFKVIYLGNLGMQFWSKDESCLEKPLNTLWNNYLVNMKTEIVMRLTVCNSGLKAITRQHGLTQYWSNRLVYCCSHKNYPRIFSWIYRHEGKKMRQELRCHAVFCPSPEKAAKMATLLNQRLACALQEFKREKKSRGVPDASNTTHSNSSQNLPRKIPLRRQILAKGSANFRPPLERSKSAPKLTSIVEEDDDEEEDSESDEVSQDVFEYAESFGDRDDDSDDYEQNGGHDDGGIDVVDGTKDDQDSTNKIESISMTTTVDEATSSSSVYVTLDGPTDRRTNNQISNENSPKSPVDWSASTINKSTNHQSGNIQQKIDIKPSNHLEKHLNPAKESSISMANAKSPTVIRISKVGQATSEKETIDSHETVELNHKSSANSQNTPCSSKQQPAVTDKSIKIEEGIDSNSCLTHQGAKTNNQTSSNKMENQHSPKQTEDAKPDADQSYDEPTQEIILSWSNLIIR